MSKKQKQDGYIKAEHKDPFLERHNKGIIVLSAIAVAGFIFAPRIRTEIADYHLMQVKVAESLALLEAIAEDHGIQEVTA